MFAERFSQINKFSFCLFQKHMCVYVYVSGCVISKEFLVIFIIIFVCYFCINTLHAWLNWCVRVIIKSKAVLERRLSIFGVEMTVLTLLQKCPYSHVTL